MEIHSETHRNEPKNKNTGEFRENNKNSPYGITTGSAATAAAIAAALTITENNVSSIDIETPFGILKIDINCSRKINSNFGRACVIKMPYNDPDVTTNLKICAEVRITENNKIKIKGGEGIGKVTKPGLQVPVGEYAINPVPRQMIKTNLQKVLPKGKGAEVTVFVPKGKEIAKRTMNSRLGIIGGISILGTTGIARPMSSKAYKESLACQIDVAVAEGYENLIFVPGNIGERLAVKILDAPKDQIIQMSNFVGYMLSKAEEKGIIKITLFGHAGKLIKISAGIFNTKNSVADGRREIIAAYCGLLGMDKEIIQTIFKSKTTEDMIHILDKENMTFPVFELIGRSIKEKCQEKYNINFDVIIVTMKGRILNKP
ncbi:cobalt-precorrin-5B (C(1))-methyltransferase CbiD [Methanobacterium sp.]|uniref:cobalt-precorrin-5B (C(1))-methyltransferase CbiD n=1 Tax=Methanobacterium sp. TaxID=2164 RepID=UPI003C777C51